MFFNGAYAEYLLKQKFTFESLTIMENIFRPKIAIAFYSITRSLKYTINSIQENIINQAKCAGDIKVYSHFYKQDVISNPRTNESATIDPDEWKLLNSDVNCIEEIDDDTEKELFNKIIQYGNSWEDSGESLRNILRQLSSLHKVTRLIENDGDFDLVIFARPDMCYHDIFPIQDFIKNIKENTLAVPNWAWSGGLNDRFAICGSEAFKIYGYRADRLIDYCRTKKKPMHSERLLMFAVQTSTSQLMTTSLRATRIRANGVPAVENFTRIKIAKRIEAYLLCNVIPTFNRIKNIFLA